MAVLMSRCLLLLLCLLLASCIQAQQQTATYYAFSDSSCQVPLFNQTISFTNVTTISDTLFSTSGCTTVAGPGGLSRVIVYCAHGQDQFTYSVAGYSSSSCDGSFSSFTSSINGWCNGFTNIPGSLVVQCNAAMARYRYAASAALAVAMSVLFALLL
jgi:hypothetical protein